MTQLTITEAAKLRGVYQSTIWRWIKKYNIKAERIGSFFVIDATDLENFTPPRRGPKGKHDEYKTR